MTVASVRDPRPGIGARISVDGSRQWLIWLAVVAFVIGPLMPVLFAGIRSTPLYEEHGALTAAHYAALLSATDFWPALGNTAYLTILVTVPSVLIGVGLAIAVARTDMPGRRALTAILIVPLLLPGLGLVLGWISMYAPAGFVSLGVKQALGFVPWNLYGIPGIALVLSCKTIPLAFLLTRASLGGMDPALENAARAAGASPMRTLASVTLPLVRPAIASACVIIASVSIEELGVPLLLGSSTNIDTLSTLLYRGWVSGSLDIGVLSAGGTLLLVVTTVLVLARRYMVGATGRYATTTGKPKAQQVVALGRLRWAVLAAVTGYVAFAIVVPLVGLVLTAITEVLTPLIAPWEVLTIQNFEIIAASSIFVRSIRNSLLIALGGAAFATLFTLLATLVAHRSTMRLRTTLPPLLLYPRAISGLVLGLGFFWVYVTVPGLDLLRLSILGILIAFAVRQVPLSYSALYPAITAVGDELDRAARSVGANWWRSCRSILVPLIKPALAASMLLTFVAILNDYDPAVFLVSPGTEVIGLTMLQQWLSGFAGPVAALGLVQIAITVVALLVGRTVLGVKKYV